MTAVVTFCLSYMIAVAVPFFPRTKLSQGYQMLWIGGLSMLCAFALAACLLAVLL